MKKSEGLRNYLVRVLHSSLKPPSTDFGWQAKECQHDVSDVSVPTLKTQPFCKLVTLMYEIITPRLKKYLKPICTSTTRPPDMRRPFLTWHLPALTTPSLDFPSSYFPIS